MAPLYSVLAHQPRYINEPFFGVSPYLTRACPGRLAPRSSLPGLERSIRRVMDPYGAGDLSEAALLPSYRCLRRRRPREDNQAAAVTQDDKTYKILLDVRDFPESCLSVRAVGDCELIVEGKVQTKEEAAPSEACKTFKNATRNFQQRFVFPGIQVEGIVSHVSSDGVLTIVAPKKVTGGAVPIEVRHQSKVRSPKDTDCVDSPGQSSEANQSEPVETANQQRGSQTGGSENPLECSEGHRDAPSDRATDCAFEQASSLSDLGGLSNSLVPVLIRGLFFHDSFFEDSRSQYEDAIKKVMKLVDKDLAVPDPIDWYKIHRTDNDQEDTRAGTVIENDDYYKVVLDVRDFEPRSLSVRAAGESELLVEGNVEKQDGDILVRRSFRKHFALPGTVKIDTITSALSTDGILTITAPKKKSEEGADSFVVKSSSATDLDTGVPSCASSSTPQSADTEIPPSRASSSGYNSNDGHEDNASTSSGQEKELTREGTPAKHVEKDQESPKFLLIGFSKDLSDCNLKETVKQRKNAGKALNPEEKETADKDFENASPCVRITRRGPFYQDSFFEDARPDHQVAVEQMLDRWVDVPSVLITETNPRPFCNFDRFHNTLSNYRSLLGHDYFDDFTCYKTLRHRSLKEESQASAVSDLQHEYKIVLDVHGFSAEDISIRATSHNELVVEGKVDQIGPSGAVSCHKFSKHFILPVPVRMNELTAALSEDDILTISVPKNSVLRIMHRL